MEALLEPSFLYRFLPFFGVPIARTHSLDAISLRLFLPTPKMSDLQEHNQIADGSTFTNYGHEREIKGPAKDRATRYSTAMFMFIFTHTIKQSLCHNQSCLPARKPVRHFSGSIKTTLTAIAITHPIHNLAPSHSHTLSLSHPLTHTNLQAFPNQPTPRSQAPPVIHRVSNTS